MDHAVSGLGFLTPHIVSFCATAGESNLQLNLVPTAPASTDARHPRPLRMAAEACQRKFIAILTQEGFDLADVSSAYLEFQVPDPTRRELFSCCCILQAAQGRRIVTKMNSDTYWKRGHKREDPFEILRNLSRGG
jgi:hypothetical protein